MNAAFVIRYSDVTSSEQRAERLSACCRLLGRPDERWLVGVAGKRRGHHITAQADRSKARLEWQRWTGEWMLRRLHTWREITLDNWKPARRLPTRQTVVTFPVPHKTDRSFVGR